MEDNRCDSPSPVADPMPPVIDQSRLAILAEALGQAKLIELCDAARQSIIESSAELRRHWQSGDRLGASRSAHRLAGVAANFGCAALARLAASIEKEGLGGGDSRQCAPQFESLLAATLAALPGPS